MEEVVETFLEFRQHLRNVHEQDDGWIVATFNHDKANREVLELASALHESGVVSEFRQDGKLVFPADCGHVATLTVRVDSGKLPGYFETFDSLIRTHPESAPSEFFVNAKNGREEAGYAAARQLLALLKTKAEVWDLTGQRFFLVGQEAVEVAFASYLAEHTLRLPEKMSIITRFLDKEHLDADVRWTFFKKASIRVLRDIPKNKRFGSLIERVGTVLERAQQDYGLFLERFSFEDLLKNFDEKRLKFIGDLNQILASIQTALVAVPIGFFLIAEKIKPASGWTVQNIILGGGGFVFFALLFVLSLNQAKSLHGIKLALADFEETQALKVTEKQERLKKLLSSTWIHYRRVRFLLWVVRILLLIFCTIVVGAVVWASTPLWQKWIP